jgi:maltose alpha-D-glucosyltransferase/alpha-amylase
MVTLHNFSDRRQTVRLDLRTPDGDRLVDVHGDHHSRAEASGAHRLDLEGYGYRWFRVGAADNTLDRAPF